MKKVLAIILLASLSTQSYAWGDREQGILIGAAGLFAIQQIARPAPAYPYEYDPRTPGHRIWTLPPPQPRPVYQEQVYWDSYCGCYARRWVHVGWQ